MSSLYDPSAAAPMDSSVWAELPAELKIEILTTTAHLYPGAAVRFALISRLYQQIFEPFIYRSIDVGRRSLILAQQRKLDYPSPYKSPSFFASHVQHLYIHKTSNQKYMKWLSLCPNIRSLAYFMPFDRDPRANPPREPLPVDMGAAVRHPHLTHLCIHSYPPYYPKYNTVTHLFLSSGIATCESLLRFPALTHFALLDIGLAADLSRQILNRLPGLEVFVVVFDPGTQNIAACMQAWGDDRRLRFLTLPTNLWDFEKPWEVWEMAGSA